MDLWDNELEPDSDGQAYYSEKYDDNSLASGCNLSSDNVSNVVEPALNVNASSVNAGNSANSVNVNVNAAVLNPKGDCAASNANATVLTGNLNRAGSNVMPSSKASYSSVVACSCGVVL